MKETNTAFQTWSIAAAVVRTVALVVLLAFIYLFLDNKPLALGTGTVTPLTVFWKLIVPLVPVILLVVPALWRNICPLASFDIAGHKLRSAIEGSAASQLRSRLRLAHPGIQLWLGRNGTYVAIALLFILVPARLFLFNTNAQALAILLLFLAALTFACGLFLPLKSGWSSSICPVYPVENLYGMNPFVYLDNTLCVQKSSENRPQTICSGCTRRCLDLKVGAAAGACERAETQWRPSPALQIFISSFPGFVLAYWLLDSNKVAEHFPVLLGTVLIYAAFLVAMLISVAAAQILRRAQGGDKAEEHKNNKRLDLALVALAFNLYYWMAFPSAVKTVGLLTGMAESLSLPIIAVGMAGFTCLTIAWLRRAW